MGLIAGDSGTVSAAESGGGIVAITFEWVAQTAGGGSQGTWIYETDFAVYGRIVRMTTEPDSGGTQPTNLFDVQLYETMLSDDSILADVLNGTGGNLANNADTDVAVVYSATSIHPTVSGGINLFVSGAGPGNGGTTTVYLSGSIT